MSNSVAFNKRAKRVRFALRNRAINGDRLRLSVFRSSKHVYAQIIDDNNSKTLVSASTLDNIVKDQLNGNNTSNKEAASIVGKVIAEKALQAGIKSVFFDRGGYIYHGRIAALADAARSGGLII